MYSGRPDIPREKSLFTGFSCHSKRYLFPSTQESGVPIFRVFLACPAYTELSGPPLILCRISAAECTRQQRAHVLLAGKPLLAH